MTSTTTSARPAEEASAVDVTLHQFDRLRRLAGRPFFAPLAVGILGLLISGIGNWIPSVWFDEDATIVSATRSWAALFAETSHVDLVHATYYSFMHLVFDAFGYTPFTLRLPSAIAVGVAAALIIVLVRQFDQPRVAVLAGLVYILLPRVAWSGGEGRSFAISALLAVAVTLVLVKALKSGRRMWWVAYTALTALSVLVFVYLAFVIAAHVIVVLSVALRGRGSASGPAPDRSLIRWVVAMAIVGFGLLPFVSALSHQTQQISWIHGVGWDTFQQVFITQWFWGTGLVMPILAWLLMAVSAFALFRRRGSGQSLDRRGLTLGMVAIPGVVIPPVALLVVTVVATPLYSPRYLDMCAPFVAIAIAAGLAIIPFRGAGALGILVIAALMLPHFILVTRAPDAKEQSTWGQVASLIATERAKTGSNTTTAIIYGPVRYHMAATTRVIEYAYPGPFAGTIDVTLATPADETGGLWETHHPLADSTSRLTDANVTYLITSIKQNRIPSTTAIMTSLGWHVDHKWNLGDVNVVRYDR